MIEISIHGSAIFIIGIIVQFYQMYLVYVRSDLQAAKDIVFLAPALMAWGFIIIVIAYRRSLPKADQE